MNKPAFRLHHNDGASHFVTMPPGSTLLDAEVAYLGKSFDSDQPDVRYCVVEVCPMLPDVQRLNRLVWAFDFATQYKHDRVTDIAELVKLADANRLHGIALDLEQFITK